MNGWIIASIVLGCLVVVGLIVFLLVYFLWYKKKQRKQVQTTPVTPSAPNKVVVQLTAVKLLKGSNIVGYETAEELSARLNKLSKADFLALDVIDFPLSKDDWDLLAGDGEKILKRNTYEMGMWFAYDSDRQIVEDKASIIRREF